MDSFRTVRPSAPVTGYIGGKRALARQIIAIVETIPHDCYAEPFIGMGGVFLRRQRAPSVEVINDRSGDVANFFRVLQRHYQAFLDMIRWQITSRREFERLAQTEPVTLTDLERAARFLYLQATAYGGKVRGRTFGVDPGSPGPFDVTRLGPRLEEVHERLAGVTIENLDWSDFIDRYDRAGTLFYLDPPYWGSEDDYGIGAFARSDFKRMARMLGSVKGTFVLSINDTPEIRDLFGAFEFVPVELNYSISGGPTIARELIILPPGRRSIPPDLFSQ